MKRNLFLYLAIISIGGCAVAPGMNMDEPPDTPNVKIMPITADLIRQQQLDNKRAPGNLEGSLNQSEAQDYQYRVGPRDILNITVWDHPELTIPAGEFRSAEAAGHLVAEDGTIFYPHAGSVEVAGKTLTEIRELLTRKISQFINRPQLDVRVAAFRSQRVQVVGEVLTPGPQPVTDIPLTVVEAVNLAGGVTVDADMVNVTLTRDDNIIEIDLQAIYARGDVSQNFLLKHGDILNIPDRNLQKVFVLGEVAAPTSLLMNKGRMSLTEAISDAGGYDRLSSDPTRVFVIRGNVDMTEIYHLNSRSPDALILGEAFRLEPHDVVYVDTAGITRWNRVIEQIVPTTAIYRNLK